MDEIYIAANEAAEEDQDFWTEFVLFFYKSTTDDEYQIFTCQKTIAQL